MKDMNIDCRRLLSLINMGLLLVLEIKILIILKIKALVLLVMLMMLMTGGLSIITCLKSLKILKN